MLRARSFALVSAVLVSLSTACSGAPEEDVGEGSDALSDGVAKACAQAPDPAGCLGTKAKEKLGVVLGGVESELRERKLLAAAEVDLGDERRF